MKTFVAGIALVAALTATSASAMQFDSLKGMMGGGSLTSGTAGNAAGILQYCMTNNYLGGDSGAAGVKEQLLGSLGSKSRTAATQDKGYLDGAKGLLKSDSGKTLDISDAGGGGDMKAQLTRKVCDAVLKQGKKMIGMGS